MNKKEVQSLEKVGISKDGDEIWHSQTKGGFHQMLKKRKKGDFTIMGQGSHRAIARVLANQFEKNIEWSESLFKSEDTEYLKKAERDEKIIPDSNNENHIAQAVWHTQQSQNSDALNKIYHSLQAIANYEAAGLDNKRALEAANNTLKKLNKSYTMDRPFDDDLLRIAYEKKTGKAFPSGE